MNNFERFRNMSPDTFADEIQKVFDTPFKEHIDWHGYMNGESEDVTDYFISKEIGRLIPTEREIILALGEQDACNEIKRRLFIDSHTKTVTILKVIDDKVYVIADREHGRILKVPACSLAKD